MILLQKLIWDSDFFGYKIGILEVPKYSNKNEVLQEIEQAKKENYKLLYLKSIEKLDFLPENACLVDEKITFLQHIPKNNFPKNPNIILYESTEITQTLINLTLQSGEFSRFKIDKNFQHQEFERLYNAWITNAILKKNLEKVYICQENDAIIGLLILGEKENRADIGILAVNNAQRGKGIGKQLVEKAFFESTTAQHTYIQVVTQKANQNACFFYEKIGFKIEKIENVYHIWL